MQKHGGKKLPAVGLAHAALTQGEIVANKCWVVTLQDHLHGENDDVRHHQAEQRDAMLSRPPACESRRFPAGEAHDHDRIANRFCCRFGKRKTTIFPLRFTPERARAACIRRLEIQPGIARSVRRRFPPVRLHRSSRAIFPSGNIQLRASESSN